MHGFPHGQRAATAVIAAALLVMPALAQGERQPGAQQEPVAVVDRALVRNDVLVGATVTRGPAGEKVAKDEKLGTISDLVIDSPSGKVRYGVLATGGTLGVGKTHLAVRWEHLVWSNANKRFTLMLDDAALQKLPKFDPKYVDTLTTHPNTMEQAEDQATQATDTAIGDVQRNDNPARANRTADALLLASKIAGGEVSAGGEKIGETEHLLIEPDRGQTVFVTVASGGVLGLGETKYVVPWSAMTFNESAKQEVQAVISSKSKSSFEKAPKLSDENGDVNKPEFQNRIFTFYGVQPPSLDGQPAAPPPAPPKDAMPPPGRDR